MIATDNYNDSVQTLVRKGKEHAASSSTSSQYRLVFAAFHNKSKIEAIKDAMSLFGSESDPMDRFCEKIKRELW